MKRYQSIYILGGHKLAVSYFEKLMHAKTEKHIDFKNLKCVTADPDALILQKTGTHNIIPLNNPDFIRQYTLNNPVESGDILIPDHTAKHVLLQAHLEIVGVDFPRLKTKLAAIESNLQTPFLHKSENDALWAVSYATWTCPPDCDEPQICPHTARTRDWDFNLSLQKLYAELAAKNVKCFDYACEPLYSEICHLPLPGIRSAFLDFKNELRNLKSEKNFLVATHSHCHGILGQFSVSP